MSIKILAAGDLHLGRKSSGVPSNTEYKTTRYVWGKMVEYAIQENINIVALTGDIVDEDNKYFEAIGALQEGFRKLIDNKIHIFMIAGNHDFDVLPQIVKQTNSAYIHLLGENANWSTELFSTQQGEKIQFIGWSFNKRHITENPLESFSNVTLDRNFITIGLLHGDVDINGSLYAPTSKNDFIQTANQVQLWILGHIHRPYEVVEQNPKALFTGSPQALSSKEQGEHGPLLITVNSKNDIQIEHILLSPIRYEEIKIDISDCESENEVRSAITDSIFDKSEEISIESEHIKHLIFDVKIVGEHTNRQSIEQWSSSIENLSLSTSTSAQISVRKVETHVKMKIENLESLSQENSPIGRIAKTIFEIQNNMDSQFLDKLIEQWRKEEQKERRRNYFNGLVQGKRNLERNDEEIKSLIENECNRILSELILQQNG